MVEPVSQGWSLSAARRQYKNYMRRLRFAWKVGQVAMNTPSLTQGGEVTFAGDGFLTTRDFGEFDPEFIAHFEAGLSDQTPQDMQRFHYILWRAHYYNTFAMNALHLTGDMLELGVWYGFNAYHVCRSPEFVESGKTFYLVDAFGFSPENLKRFPKSMAKYSNDIYDMVASRFADSRATLIQGFIPDVLLENEARLPERICFLSMDLNDATFEKAGIELVWDRLVDGGFVYIDDYGDQKYKQTRDFYEDFAKRNKCRILKTPFCCAVLQKMPK